MLNTWPSMAMDMRAASTQPLMNREVGDELQVGWALPVHIKARVHSRLVFVSFLFIYFYFNSNFNSKIVL